MIENLKILHVYSCKYRKVKVVIAINCIAFAPKTLFCTTVQRLGKVKTEKADGNGGEADKGNVN